jgi:hypothetical protein
MSEARPITIPVILGTTRQGRMSVQAASFVTGELMKRRGVAAELIDILEMRIPVDDAGEGIKDLRFSEVAFRSECVASSVESACNLQGVGKLRVNTIGHTSPGPTKSNLQ